MHNDELRESLIMGMSSVIEQRKLEKIWGFAMASSKIVSIGGKRNEFLFVYIIVILL